MVHLIGIGTNPAHDAGAVATVDPQTGALTMLASIWHLVLHGYVPDSRPEDVVDVRQAVAERWPQADWERTVDGWMAWCRGKGQRKQAQRDRVPATMLGGGPGGLRVTPADAKRLCKQRRRRQ